MLIRQQRAHGVVVVVLFCGIFCGATSNAFAQDREQSSFLGSVVKGVVLDPTTSKMIIGRLPIEKLAALAELKSVRYVAPQTK